MGIEPRSAEAENIARAWGILNYNTTLDEAVQIISGAEDFHQGGDRDRLLLNAIQPCYEKIFLQKERDGFKCPPEALAVSLSCPHTSPVVKNKFYKGLDSQIVRDHLGCSFCRRHSKPRRDESKRPSFVSEIKRVLRQIEAHQKANPDISRFEYRFEESVFNLKLAGFLEACLERNLKPSTFTTMLRADTLLSQRGDFEKALAGMLKAGHRLELISIGAENFSPRENERFNKHLSVDQIWLCYEMIKDFESRFSGSFGCLTKGYFVAILFTPWTTPGDLKVNIEAAKRLGADWLKTAAGTRLMLWEDAAITELARHDNLLAEKFGSVADVSSVSDVVLPEIRELPWRFADRRTELIHRILIRLNPIPEQAVFSKDDHLLQEVRRLQRNLGKELAEYYVGLAEAVVDAVVALGHQASPEEVFAHIAAKSLPLSGEDMELRFDVRNRNSGGDIYEFHVALHKPGRNYFRRKGPLIFWYSSNSLAPPALEFADVILEAMESLSSTPLSAACLEDWRKEINKLLERKRMTARFGWTVDLQNI